MLKGKNLAQLKELKVEYDKVYLDFGPKDQLEKFTRKSDGVPIELEKGKVWEGLQPMNPISVHTPEELYNQAIDYFSGKYPEKETLEMAVVGSDGKKSFSTAEREVSALIRLLQRSTVGEDFQVRNQALEAAKPFDRLSAIANTAKDMRKAYPKWSEEKIKKMSEAAWPIGEPEDEETNGNGVEEENIKVTA